MRFLSTLQTFLDISLPLELNQHKLSEAVISLKLLDELLFIDAVRKLQEDELTDFIRDLLLVQGRLHLRRQLLVGEVFQLRTSY